MKKFLIVAGFGVAMLPALAANAQDAQDTKKDDDMIPGEFSANVALTSEYFFRGISQSDDRPAIQGGFDWSHDIGVHAGIWASNVDFTDAVVEIDYSAGFGRSIGDFSYDISGIYYTYPGAMNSLDYDFFEVAGSASYDFGFASVTGGINYSPNYFGDSGSAVYPSLSVNVPIGDYFYAGGHVGYQSISDETKFGVPDYVDWGLNVGATYKGFDFNIAYTDTDLSESECTDLCDPTVLFTVSKSF
jgi:uncharacterized protein (TIGR02001 family)